MINLGLLNVNLPARYYGGEIFSSIKTNPKIKFGLAFPDTYEIGMSHLGFKFLYTILDSMTDVQPERIFSPWLDEDKRLRDSHEELFTLETKTKLHELDIIGFSLQYELSLTGVLQILDLGKIEIERKNRKESDPIIICGGPLATNPAILNPIFDGIYIGDGENGIKKIAEIILDAKEKSWSRNKKLEALSKVDGLYIPSLNNKVTRAVLADINEAPAKLNFPIPSIQAIHDRITFEIQRGCTNGCRFCQAGYIYRPLRQKSPEIVLEHAENELDRTGYDELGLLSLSSGDYYCLVPLLERLSALCDRTHTGLSLPSLRAETLNSDIVDNIAKGRPVNLTVAPEAGSERLRKYINKQGDQDISLLEAVKLAGKKNINNIKAYFMIGLPTETNEDLDAMVELCKQAKAELRRNSKRSELTVSVSTFVPKPWTPFQWERQISIEETKAKQVYLRDKFRDARIKYKYHDHESSFLEGVLTRGDAKIGETIIEAYKLGAKFDAWGEQLKMDIWNSAFSKIGIVPEEYLQARNIESELPWDFINGLPAKAFLKKEKQNADTEIETHDCRLQSCNGCGMCSKHKVENIIYTLPQSPLHPEKTFTEVRGWFPQEIKIVPPSEMENYLSQVKVAAASKADVDGVKIKGPAPVEHKAFRVKFTRVGPASLIGHVDMINVFSRAFKRSDIKIKYTEGFHRHPQLVFSPPLSLGIESVAEFMDFKLLPELAAKTSIQTMIEKLNSHLPEGLRIVEGFEHTKKMAAPISTMDKNQFKIKILNADILEKFAEKYAGLKKGELIFFTKKEQNICINDYIESFDFNESTSELNVMIKYIDNKTLNPYDMFLAMTGAERAILNAALFIRKENSWTQS